MEQLNDRWLRTVEIPLVAIVGNFIFHQPANDAHHISRWLALSLSLVECVMLWEVLRIGIIRARRRFPWLNQNRSRILMEVIWFVIATVVIRVGTTYVYDVTQF